MQKCPSLTKFLPNCTSYNILQVFESSDHGIFRVDDVFVTGMLAEKANVSHRDISDLITFYEDWDEEVSIKRKSRRLSNCILKWVLSQTVGDFRRANGEGSQNSAVSTEPQKISFTIVNK